MATFDESKPVSIRLNGLGDFVQELEDATGLSRNETVRRALKFLRSMKKKKQFHPKDLLAEFEK